MARQEIIEEISTLISGNTKDKLLIYVENTYWDQHTPILFIVHENWEWETLEEQSDETLNIFSSLLIKP